MQCNAMHAMHAMQCNAMQCNARQCNGAVERGGGAVVKHHIPWYDAVSCSQDGSSQRLKQSSGTVAARPLARGVWHISWCDITACLSWCDRSVDRSIDLARCSTTRSRSPTARSRRRSATSSNSPSSPTRRATSRRSCGCTATPTPRRSRPPRSWCGRTDGVGTDNGIDSTRIHRRVPCSFGTRNERRVPGLSSRRRRPTRIIIDRSIDRSRRF